MSASFDVSPPLRQSWLAALFAQLCALMHFFGAPTTWRVALTFVSMATTLLGLMQLYDTLGGDHGGGSIGWLPWVIPIALAGALHSLIYWMLGQWALRRKLNWLTFAVCLQLLAVVASYGVHFTHMRGPSATIESYTTTHAQVLRGVAASLQSYQVLAAATEAAAQHSEKQAKVEAESGGSCGGAPKTGRGDRYDLRMADKITFVAFNTDVASRRKQFEELVARAESEVASTASDAAVRVNALRSIVNKAKVFESDVLLPQLRQAAQERILKGRGPMPTSARQRRLGEGPTFICPDLYLEHVLVTVVGAISQLKPVPEVKWDDSRDPRVGFATALGRIFGSLRDIRVLPLSRSELKEDRKDRLAAKEPAHDHVSGADITPMVIATVIEAALTLLFTVGGESLPVHPGLIKLGEVARRRRNERILDAIWAALGGPAAHGTIRDTLARFTKYEGTNALILVPAYSTSPEARTLNYTMMLLAEAGLAKHVYTGTAFARLFTLGWPSRLRREALESGALRVYRMTRVDYVAFILDAVHGAANHDEYRAMADADAEPAADVHPDDVADFKRAA